MDTEQLEPLLTPEETAARLKMEVSTLSNWRVRRVGPKYIKVVGLVRYPEPWLKEYIEELSARQQYQD